MVLIPLSNLAYPASAKVQFLKTRFMEPRYRNAFPITIAIKPKGGVAGVFGSWRTNTKAFKPRTRAIIPKTRAMKPKTRVINQTGGVAGVFAFWRTNTRAPVQRYGLDADS